MGPFDVGDSRQAADKRIEPPMEAGEMTLIVEADDRLEILAKASNDVIEAGDGIPAIRVAGEHEEPLAVAHVPASSPVQGDPDWSVTSA